VNILILLKHLPEVVDIVFQVPSLIGILSMEISVSLLILHLFLNILLVKPNHTLLKFLEVCNVMQAFENVILELLLVAFLLLKLLSQVLHFVGETLLSHSEIVNDQGEVLVHSVEVFQLLSHLVSLLVQFLNL